MSYTSFISPSKSLFLAILCVCVSASLATDVQVLPAEEIEEIQVQIEQILSTAQQYMSSQNIPLAVAEYQKIPPLSPASAYALDAEASIVKIQLQTQDFAAAETQTDQMWTRYRTRPEFVGVMGDLKRQYWFADQRQTSQALCQQLVTAFPDHPQAVYLQRDLIFGSLAMNDLTAAKTQAEQMLAQYQGQPDFVRCAHDVGWEFAKNYDYTTAIEIYNDLKQQFPDHEHAVLVQRSMIEAYLAKGDVAQVTEAVEDLKNNFKGFQDYIPQMEYVSDRLTEKEHHELAKGICELLLEQYPAHEDQIWFLHKKIRSELGLGSEASADAGVAVIHQKYATCEEYHDALSWIAYDYRTYGYYDKAIKMYQELYAKTPDKDIQLRCDEGVARSYVRQGEDAKVQEQIDRLYANYSKDNPDEVAFYIYAIGEQYYLMAEGLREKNEELAKHCYRRAIEVWEPFLERIPASDLEHQSHVHYFLALAYQSLGEYEKAIDYFTEIVEGYPSYERRWHALSMLAVLYEEQQRENKLSKDAAISKIKEVYQAILESYPTAPAAEIAKIWLQEN